MQVQAYLSFEGRAQVALDFYKKALGAKEGMVMRFRDAPPEAQANMTRGSEDKIMHMSFTIGDTELMGSDGYCTGKPNFQGMSLTYNAKDAGEAEKVFKALGDGGEVKMPLNKTFFSPAFGMLADKFGVGWMVIVPQQM
jgi:PhnB protein